MITGSVHPGGEIVVPVRLRGPNGFIAEVQSVVDTGFNDWLTLSPQAIDELALRLREEGRYTLADGSQAVARPFALEIDWFGQWRRILAVEIDGGPLLGMATIRGCYLGIEVIDGGHVEIRPLNP